MRENKDDQKLYLASKSRSSRSSKHPSKCEAHHQNHHQREKQSRRNQEMAELMTEASSIEKKHFSRYQTEKPEPEEKVAKLRAKVRNSKAVTFIRYHLLEDQAL